MDVRLPEIPLFGTPRVEFGEIFFFAIVLSMFPCSWDCEMYEIAHEILRWDSCH